MHARTTDGCEEWSNVYDIQCPLATGMKGLRVRGAEQVAIPSSHATEWAKQ